MIVISPAKTLDFERPFELEAHSQPDFLDQSERLVEALRRYSPQGLADLMQVSDKIAQLNHQRNAAWSRPFTPQNAKQALLVFKGDVYVGLDAESFSPADFEAAQERLRILSGLYGLLRPLDLMQPYRLEMGTPLANPEGKDLYAFWELRLTDRLNEELRASGSRYLLNLASNEYFKAIRQKHVKATVISPIFRELKDGQYKMVSFYAKKARGLMTRFVLQNGIRDPRDLAAFDLEGYRHDPDLSTEDRPFFARG